MRWKDVELCSLENRYRELQDDHEERFSPIYSCTCRYPCLLCFTSKTQTLYTICSSEILAFLDDQNTSMSPHIARHVLRLSPNVDSNTNVFITPTLPYHAHTLCCIHPTSCVQAVVFSVHCRLAKLAGVRWRLATLAGVDVVDEVTRTALDRLDRSFKSWPRSSPKRR